MNFSQEQTCPGLSNELNQAATYPSPYANVHKGNMNTMGGSTGVGKDDTWKPSTMEMRTSNTEKVNNFIASLPPNLSEKNKNFSDDGASETNELTMSIGSMVCWNFGDQVRSRDFQYLLHCVSVKGKDQIMHDLWKQHTEEMKNVGR